MSDNIDKQNRREFERRRLERREQDQIKGLNRRDRSCWGDHPVNRAVEDTMKDYLKYKDPKDRKQITDEFYGIQKEYRKRPQNV